MALEMTGGPSRSEVSMWAHLEIRDPANLKLTQLPPKKIANLDNLVGNQDTPLIHTVYNISIYVSPFAFTSMWLYMVALHGMQSISMYFL